MIAHFRETALDWNVYSAIAFFAGCNFVCFFCHNKELIDASKHSDVTDEFLKYLSKETTKSLVKGVVLSGGEPTVYGSKLLDLCATVKSLGYKIKLDTNGSNPSVLSDLIENKLIDAVYMDYKTSLPKYFIVSNNPLTSDNIRRSIEILKSSGVEVVFRTTVVTAQGLVTLEDIEKISQDVAPFKLVLQKYSQEPDVDLEKYKTVASRNTTVELYV